MYFWGTHVKPVENRVLVIPPLKEQPQLNEDPNPTKAGIHRQAESIFKSYGLPLGLATAMLRYESSTGDLMISKTGCLGWFQFCKKTAKAYGLKDPMDLEESTHATARLMKDNERVLAKGGVYSNPMNLYLAHMIGASGTKYLYKALDGRKLSRNQHNTLLKVIKPNWYSKHMGKFKGTDRDLADRFIKHVEVMFDKLTPTYS